MSQQNLYSRINTATRTGLSGKETLAQKGNAAGISPEQQLRDLQKLYNKEMEINAVKKKNYDIDFKTNGLFKGTAKMMSKLYKENQDYVKSKKDVVNQEKDLVKLMKEANDLQGKTGAAEIAQFKIKDEQAKKLIYEISKRKENLELTKRALPMGGALSGIMGKMGAAAAVFNGVLASVSSIFSLLTLPLKLIGDLISGVWQNFLKIQSITGNLAADIGLTSKESYYFKDNFAELANSALSFGGTMEDVASTMKVFSEETNKNPMFNKDSMDRIMELAKGTGLGAEGAAKMVAGFDNIGLSIKQTTDHTNKARDMAARFGLNATKMLQTVGTFVKTFQGFTFKNGLDGINKMVAKAESLRFDLSAIKGISEKLFNPEGAVEAAAHLQVLGGKFAQMGDPFGLMYAAQNAPEELAKGIMDATKGMAKKGADGMFRISPADMMIIKEAATALGQSADNMITAAIEQGKMSDKLSASKFLKDGMFNDEDKTALSNLITMNKDNQYVIRMPNGFEQLVSQIPNAGMFKDILDERKKNEKAGIERKNWSERFDQILQRFMNGFTQPLIKLEGIFNDTNMINQIEELGKTIGDQLIPLFNSVFKPDGKIHAFIANMSTSITGLMTDVTNLFNSEGSFMEHVKTGFIKIFKGLYDIVGPYMKFGFGKLFEILGNALPSWLGGASLKASGIEMQTNAAMSSAGVAKASGLDTAGSLQAQKTKQMGAYKDSDVSDKTVNSLAYGLAGAAIGSVIPGVGTAIGAGLGLAYATYKNMTMGTPEERYASEMKNQGPSITPVATARYASGELNTSMGSSSNNQANNNLNITGSINVVSPDGRTKVTMDDMRKMGIHVLAQAVTNEQNKTSKGYGLNDSKDIKHSTSI